MKKLLLLLYFCVAFLKSFAQYQSHIPQHDSCALNISLLTCAPGSELYSTFGHTAIRVQNTELGYDEVYNYGTFEFGPDFYTKFIRGKLLYFLSVESFEDFIYQYEMESRSIQEQILLLDCGEKHRLLEALHQNAQPQNRYYRYDFLRDNCTTRARDMIREQTKDSVLFKNILGDDKPTFRDLIHSYLDAGHQPWSKLGIDILLGAPLDQRVTNEESMFLPDYLLRGFDSASTGGRPLVAPPRTILSLPSPLGKASIFTPFLVFLTLLVAVLALQFSKKTWAIRTLRIFDRVFFLLLGLAGLLLLFMWFGTDHDVCRNNYNLLWALPLHVIGVFFLENEKAKNWFRLVSYLSIALLVAWVFLPQEMNNALIPIVILVAVRSWKISG